ncbi:MAG: hypothetical protein RMJ28_01055 [Nitrososphaerota archaeon]|nr:hypothetical protein [Candidatus Calditenuaceae archaeon]MDW8072820.1 hypothetical protein [Nitrososphaerota archaeon]
MEVIFYGYKRCNTSRKIEAALRTHDVKIRFVDIVREPPEKAVLNRLIEKYGVEGIVRRGKLEARLLLEKEGLENLLEFLRREPNRLIRPVVIAGGEVYAGLDALKLTDSGGGLRR